MLFGDANLVTRQYIFAFAALFLFFFSNLVDRLVFCGASFSFYLLVCIGATYYIIRESTVRWRIAVLIPIIYFSIFQILKGEEVWSAIAAVKDLCVPIMAVLLGYSVFSRHSVLNMLNWLFLPFVVYGLIQVVSFELDSMREVLPWDIAQMDLMTASGVKSLYQSSQLRFFGTLNSFFHYQLIVAIMPLFLWLNRAQLKHRWLLVCNSLLAIVLVVMFRERTPLIVLGVFSIMFLAFGNRQLRMVGFSGSVGVCVVAFGLAFANFGGALNQSGPDKGGSLNESDPELRMQNVIYLNLDRDTSTVERLAIWKEALKELTAENIVFGKSPSMLLPGYEARSPESHISPHNFFLFILLAYGLVGAGLFFGFLFLVYYDLLGNTAHLEWRLFMGALLLAFILLSIYHVPFIGKLGFMFFLFLGVALANANFPIGLKALRMQTSSK
ncbi:MAG: O-antigen ligase family protein [Sideroxyarcus sp.]